MLTQWDVNIDVKVYDGWAQVTGLKIQVKHMEHLFRVYIKSMGKILYAGLKNVVI
jgi:hypothetical protein